jgi:hypothetical protein
VPSAERRLRRNILVCLLRELGCQAWETANSGLRVLAVFTRSAQKLDCLHQHQLYPPSTFRASSQRYGLALRKARNISD